MINSCSPDLEGVRTFAESGSQLVSRQKAEAQSLLNTLDSAYKKVGSQDPFRIDLASNNAFASSREEAYRDWLGWLFRQILRNDENACSSLSGILGLSGDLLLEVTESDIRREVPVPKGHRDHSGRVDLVINARTTVVCIEIKKGPAEGADLAKNKGYEKSIERQCRLLRKTPKFFLLVTRSPRKKISRHTVLEWRTLCINLRKYVASCCPRRTPLPSLVLLFVGAVEQCILGFGADGFMDDATHAHIREILVAHKHY